MYITSHGHLRCYAQDFNCCEFARFQFVSKQSACKRLQYVKNPLPPFRTCL